MYPPINPELLTPSPTLGAQVPPIAPTPTGVSIPSGTDDYAQQQGYDDEYEENDYDNVEAIDKKNIKGIGDKDFLEGMGRFLRDTIREAINARSIRDNNITVYRRMYECAPVGDTGIQKGRRSKVVPPDTRNACDTVAARQLEALLSGPDYLTIKSPLPEDSDACFKAKHFAMYWFDRLGPLEHGAKLARMLRNIGTDGLVIVHTFWRRERRKRKRRVIINNTLLRKMGLPLVANPTDFPNVTIEKRNYKYGETVVLEYNEVVADHFDYHLIDSRDAFLWPPAYPRMQDAPIAGYLYDETPNQMRQKANAGEYDADVVKELVGDAANFDQNYSGESGNSATTDLPNPDDSTEQSYSDGVSRTAEQSNPKQARRRLVHCYARIHDADTRKDDNEELPEYDDLCIIFDYASGKILKCQLNPYDNGLRPFIEFGCDPRVGLGFFHYSLVEKCSDSQQEITVLTRQGLDAGTLALTKFVVQGPGRRKLSDQPAQAGINVLEVGTDGEIIKVHEFSDVPPSNSFQKGETRRMIQLTAGADESVQGTTVKGETTLGQTNLAVAGGNIRMNFGLTFILTSMTKLFRQFFDFNQQFGEPSQLFVAKVNGVDIPMDITLDDLVVTSYAKVQAYSPVLDPNAAFQMQMAQTGFTTMAQSPLVGEDMVKQGRLINWFLRKIKIDDDLTPILGTEEDWTRKNQELQQQKMMQAQMMQAQYEEGVRTGNLKTPTGVKGKEVSRNGTG